MPVDTAPVVIRIEVTDGNSGAVVAALEKSFQQLGAAGAAAGKQVQTGMAGMSAAAKAAAGIPASAAATPAAISNWSVRQKQSTQEATRAQLDLNAAIEQGVAAGMSFDDTMNAAYAAMAKTNAQATALRTTMASTWREAAGMGTAGAVMPGGVRPSGTGTAPRESGSGDVARDAAAMAAYDAISARSVDSAKRLGAAFDAARAQGLGFTEAVAASVAAIEAEDAAAASAGRATLGMGQAYGETRVMMGAMTGSMGQMESGFARMLAGTKALQPVMSGLFDVAMIGAGLAMVAEMGYETYKFYENWVELRDVLEQVDGIYRRIGDDIDRLSQRQNAATEDYLRLTQGAGAADRYKLEQLGQRPVDLSSIYSEKQFKGLSDDVKGKFESLTGETIAPKDLDGAIQKLHQYNSELSKTLAIDQGIRQNAGAALSAMDLTGASGGSQLPSDRQIKELQAQLELGQQLERYLGQSSATRAAELKALNAQIRKDNDPNHTGVRSSASNEDELARIHEQALEARLHGEALYRQQMEGLITDLERRGISAAKAVNAAQELYHNQEVARLQDERSAVAQRARQADDAGMTGVAQIQAEGVLRDQQIMADAGAGKYLSLSDAQKDRVSNWRETNARILESEEDFARQMVSISESWATRQISEFGRIHAEAQRQIEAMRGDLERRYAGANMSDPAVAAAYANDSRNVQVGIAGVQSGEKNQTADVMERRQQETAQIEAQARVRMMSAEKQQTAAIEEEYEERVRKYQDSLNQDLAATEGNLTLQQQLREDFNRRVAAAQEEMNAQLVEQARQAREKIAGELRGLMGAHPLEALQEIGSKMAAQAGAAMLQRAAAHYGVNPEVGTQNLFDRMAGMPRGSSGRVGALHGAATSTAIAHAEIHVDQASIYAGGAAGAAGSRGGSTWMMGGGGAGSGSTAIPGGGFSGGGRSGSSSGSGSWEPSWSGGFSPTLSGGPTTAAASSSGGVGGGSGTSWTGSGMTSATPMGTGPKAGLGFTGIAQDTLAGAQTTRSIIGMMRSGKSQQGAAGALQPTDANQQYDINGNPVSSGSGGGSAVSTAVGAGADALGLFAAHKQGGMGGTLGGAMSGAQLGMMVGGPVGAAIGAVAGAAIGFFGGGEQARVWWLKQGQPRLYNDMDAYQQGSMDYLSAYMDMEQLDTQAKHTLKSMGFEGARYYSDTVEGQIRDEITKLSREQKAGRSASTFSAAQYATGTDYVPGTGMAVLHEGERVVPSDQNERITRAIENPPTMAPAAQATADVNLHFHSPDAKGARDLLLAHATTIRAALNSSYADYGGLGDND